RFGPAGDDELLLVLQLELAPCGAATPGFIERAGFFRDQSFPAFFLRARVQLARVARDLLADPNHSGWRSAEAPDRLLEAAAALRQRQPRQILLAVLQDVERDEDRGLRGFGALHVLRAAQVHPSLQPLESRRPAAFIERDDLTVEDQRPIQPRPSGFERLY